MTTKKILNVCMFLSWVLLGGFGSLVQAESFTRKVVTLNANDLVWSPLTQRIYASVPGNVPQIGNSITVINPYTGTIENSVFVGSEPTKMALSDNNQDIYVALDGAAAIRRFHAPTKTAGMQFTLGSGSYGPRYAEDISVQPGNANVVAVSLYRKGVSPRHDGCAIFDNGVMRSKKTADHTGSNVIEFSDSPDTLYGYNNETTEYGFRTMQVDATGVTVTKTTAGLISGFSTDIEYDNSTIYSTNGDSINPVTGLINGIFNGGQGKLEPDSSVGRTFYINGSTIKAFDQSHYLYIDSIALPSFTGQARNLIRWGNDGLAFATTGGQIMLVQTPLVPEPLTLSLLALGGLALRRRK